MEVEFSDAAAVTGSARVPFRLWALARIHINSVVDPGRIVLSGSRSALGCLEPEQPDAEARCFDSIDASLPIGLLKYPL